MHHVLIHQIQDMFKFVANLDELGISCLLKLYKQNPLEKFFYFRYLLPKVY